MKRMSIGILVLALVFGVSYGGVVAWAKHKASGIELKPLVASGPSVVLAGDGKQVGRIASAEAGKALTDDQVSTLVRHAHMAAEDRRFYEHGAISTRGMAWAMFTNAREGTLAAGGSTITQQIAKRYAGNEKTIERKLDELPYAYRLEQEYGKDQLLTIYVNGNYYGRGAYGIEDAALTWFGVSASKDMANMSDPLQVARAAFLAALIKQPSIYDDYDGKPSNLKYAKDVWDRTRYVLDGLREIRGSKQSLVSAKVVADAKALLPLKLTDKVKATGSAVEGDPFVMGYVREWMTAWQAEIVKKRGGINDADAQKEAQQTVETLLARGGLKIQTDLVSSAQARLVSAHKQLGAGQSGLVVINPLTGGIAAISGGRDYARDPFNYAMYANRPPGSTIKAFVLADAVSKGVSAKSEFAAPGVINIDGPPITDHGGKDAAGCKMSLADALAVSHNVVYVEAITGKMASCQDRKKLSGIKDYPVNPKSVASLLRKAGAEATTVPDRSSPIKIGEAPRLAIGDTLELSPLKLATMAGTLATGKYHKPYLVRNITNANGLSIFEHESEAADVLEEKHVRVVNQALTGVFTKGTAKGAQVGGHPLAGKTGTTDAEQGDSWAFAYNAVDPKKKVPTYVFAGWAGQNPNRAGADVMKVAQNFFQGVLNGTPTVSFPEAKDEGKLYGVTKAEPPAQPTATKSAQPEPPATSAPPKRTNPPATSPPGRPPSTQQNGDNNRTVPPPENPGQGANTGTVPVPGG